MGNKLTKDQERAKKLTKEIANLNKQIEELDPEDTKGLARLLKQVGRASKKLAELGL